MNVSELVPVPNRREPFKRAQLTSLPVSIGCYVLTTFEGTILYIGQARNLRNRISQHVDCPGKSGLTPLGRAGWVYFLETPEIDLIERTWINAHDIAEGALPLMNKLNAPVRV